MLINIHTHHQSSAKEITIVNLYEKFNRVTEKGLYSAGLHPCYLSNASFDELVNRSKEATVVAIGECGLDKICTTDFLQQQQIFAKQVQLANSLQKPIIIHCVRAWDEVLNILQGCNVPIVFHGFNKSKELALQLTAKGYYLSFGKALEHERMKQVLSKIPLHQILLETDTAVIPIETVYDWAAEALQLNLDLLSLQIANNATSVFGNQIIEQ